MLDELVNKEFKRIILNNTAMWLNMLDKDANVTMWNKAAEYISGYSKEEVLGNSNIWELLYPDEEYRTSIYNKALEVISQGEEITDFETTILCKDGSNRALSWNTHDVKDESGDVIGSIAIARDVTELKDIQDKLTHKAHFDMLTNLPNRTLFFDRLEKTLAISKRKNHAFALLFIDLDSFKSINDKYGHAIGDQLLVEVSKKIQSCIRESDTVARIGGDEFVILLTEIASIDEPGITAERIIDILTKPIQVKDHACNIGASIGISLYPEHSSNLDELLVLADKAMYEVKHFAKNNCRYAK